MQIRKVARRILSVADAFNQFWNSPPPQKRYAKLALEALEVRAVPTITVSPVDADGFVKVVNDTSAETVRIDTTTNPGDITFTTSSNVPISGGSGVTISGFTAIVPVTGVKAIAIDDPVGSGFLSVIVNNIAGATDLRQFDFTSENTGDNTVNLGQTNFTNTSLNATSPTDNPDVYYALNMGSGFNEVGASDSGVTNLLFDNVTAGSSVALQPDATNTKLALDFKGVTNSGVQVNLNATPDSTLATTTDQLVDLAFGTNVVQNVTAVYGNAMTDTLIGNNVNNYLVGGGGDNTTITDGNGNDQLNAVRDFSPALAGTQASGVSSYNYTLDGTIVDLTQFAGISSAFSAASNSSFGPGGQTSGALYGQFGFFNFGEGVAAENGLATATSTQANTLLTNDFNTANGITSPAVSVTLVAGNGNDGLYGFNGAAVNAIAGNGNNAFSSNTGGQPSTYKAGNGSNEMVGAVGDTLIVGTGVNSITIAVANPAASQSLQTTIDAGANGMGASTITAGLQNVTIDAGQGTDTVTLANVSDNVLIYNSTTMFGPDSPLSSLTQVQLALKP